KSYSRCNRRSQATNRRRRGRASSPRPAPAPRPSSLAGTGSPSAWSCRRRSETKPFPAAAASAAAGLRRATEGRVWWRTLRVAWWSTSSRIPSRCFQSTIERRPAGGTAQQQRPVGEMLGLGAAAAAAVEDQGHLLPRRRAAAKDAVTRHGPAQSPLLI